MNNINWKSIVLKIIVPILLALAGGTAAVGTDIIGSSASQVTKNEEQDRRLDLIERYIQIEMPKIQRSLGRIEGALGIQEAKE